MFKLSDNISLFDDCNITVVRAKITSLKQRQTEHRPKFMFKPCTGAVDSVNMKPTVQSVDLLKSSNNFAGSHDCCSADTQTTNTPL
ncbi:hypothetical protein OUZ56_000761 [Daphnia magna]|uniref:Uncharacterized protein n=1 Tax=Daphnia magna TaxID=35525 RepID=A0ABR0A0U4_9CRUS|nr:hypothetical protein OUZ56_000761 [Daphnia magna]